MSAIQLPSVIARSFGEDANLYTDVLGTTEDATMEELRKAYYKQGSTCLELAKDFRRDKRNQQDADDPGLRFKAVSGAYQILRDPEKRSLYDELLSTKGDDKENAAKNRFVRLFDLEDEGLDKTLGDTDTAKNIFFGIFGSMKPKIAPVNKNVRSDVRMFSVCSDEEDELDTSGSVGLRGDFIDAFLEVLQDEEKGLSDVNFLQVLTELRSIISNSRNGTTVRLTPQLTCSRPFDVNDRYHIVNPKEICAAGGVRRAILIGITYGKTDYWASHANVDRIKYFLTSAAGFKKENLTVLMDDDEHIPPTKENMLNAFSKLAKESKPGDTAFFLFSGRGGWRREWTGDESDGRDELIYPVDFEMKGVIVDDDIFEILVEPLKEGVMMTVLMDCSHSGTALDLPFIYSAERGEWAEEVGRGAVASILRGFKKETDVKGTSQV